MPRRRRTQDSRRSQRTSPRRRRPASRSGAWPCSPVAATVANAVSAGRATHDRGVAGISAERGGVALHPLQRELLVLESIVAGVVAECRVREEAKDPEAVRDSHHDHVTLGGDLHLRVQRRVATLEAAAMDVHEHRQWTRAEVGRDRDVREQAVLVRPTGWRHRPADMRCRASPLGAGRSRRRVAWVNATAAGRPAQPRREHPATGHSSALSGRRSGPYCLDQGAVGTAGRLGRLGLGLCGGCGRQRQRRHGGDHQGACG
jgi:hypothetical protein